MVKQISVFMENKVGMLSKFSKVISEAKLSILAMCLADTTDFGILRLIVSDPDSCLKVLRDSGFSASPTNVLIVKLETGSQSMENVFDALAENSITVEYMYSFARSLSDDITVIFKVDHTERAIEVLAERGLQMVSEEEIAALKC